jgi:hypothetical protein
VKKVLLPFLLSGVAAGQAVHIAGGQSSLQNAAGGGATFYLPGNQLYIGGGRGFGISDKFTYRHLDFTAGDSMFAYAVDGAGTSLFERGLKVEKKVKDRTVGAFAGLVGLSYSVPFFSSMYQAKYPGAGVYFNQKLGKWTFNSLEVFSRQKTLIQSAKYDGQKIEFYANGGIIQNVWQASGTFIFTPTKGFNVAASDTHQLNYLSDSLSGSFNSHGFQAHGAWIRNTFNNREIRGETVGAGWSHKWLAVRSAYYKSSNQHQLIVNQLTETTRHWSLTEAINSANQFQVGGAYHNNSLSLSVNHSIAFIPGQGYQSIVSIGVSFKVHDSQVNSQEYLLPGNKLKYSAYGDQWILGPLQTESIGHHMQKSIGKSRQTGIVVKEDGSPVEGAAVKVGKETVYTDRNGHWELRHRKKISATICIDLDDFITPGTWKLVSQTDSQIVVKKL